MRKMCAKLVPKLLTDDQKNHQVTVATELLKQVELNIFWTISLVGMKHETKCQSSEWPVLGRLKPPKTRALAEVPVEAFQDAYCAWQCLACQALPPHTFSRRAWKKCVDAQGNYFEEK
ncbi:hypothetical protein J437_LFUL019157 [Ladona fulva]|uniref:Uncharacterized protein n=1 Tax=Ladona fulva TaxID=123851 RepID=A0A8K0PDW3_LADFU|nr:hypothetical protein J437_LFUL019157 [Ladona fulva]